MGELWLPWKRTKRTEIQVSSMGRVRTLLKRADGSLREKLLSLVPMKGKGLRYLGFCYRNKETGRIETYAVHVAVADSHLSIPPESDHVEYHVDHVDHDTLNNQVDNLRYREAGFNMRDNKRKRG